MSKCQATQHNDQFMCPCGLAWDVNDPDPPTCPSTKQEARANSGPAHDEQLAHQVQQERPLSSSRTSSLSAILRTSPVASAPLPADVPIGHPSNTWIREKAQEAERAQAVQLPYNRSGHTMGDFIFHLAYQAGEADSLRRKHDQLTDQVHSLSKEADSLRAQLDKLVLERVETDANLEKAESTIAGALAALKG